MATDQNAETRTRRRALSLLGASGVSLLTGRFAGSVSAKRKAPDRNVTAMSYNIHHGAGSDGQSNLTRTARVIRESGAEIVGLQEVDGHWGARSNFEHQAKRLAEMLDMNYFFAPIYSLEPPEQNRPRREYGLAVLSAYPILRAENHEITRLSTQIGTEPQLAPGFPEVRVNVRGVTLSFYATHLDYRADPAVRRMQVADMLRILDTNREPTLLVGDLNATPEASELAPLLDTFGDAWGEQGNGTGYTFPARNPTKRIDYVLTSSAVETTSVRVGKTRASDHRPVVTELSLSGTTVGNGRSEE